MLHSRLPASVLTHARGATDDWGAPEGEGLRMKELQRGLGGAAITALREGFGQGGASVQMGQAIQVIGVVTALIAGAIATRDNYQKPGQLP